MEAAISDTITVNSPDTLRFNAKVRMAGRRWNAEKHYRTQRDELLQVSKLLMSALDPATRPEMQVEAIARARPTLARILDTLEPPQEV